VFVDDASSNPDTWPSLKELAQKFSNITVIRLMRNFGRGPAVLCAMKYAKGDFLISMDDDLQHRPEDIPLLLEHNNHDIVIGKFAKKNHSMMKRITSNVKSWVDYIALKKPKGIRLGSFLLMNRQVAEAMLSVRTANPFFAALLFYASRDIVMVPVHHDSRAFGKSELGTVKRIRQFSNLLINNSTLIPRFLILLGLTIFSASVLASIYLVYLYLAGNLTVAGWGSLMVVTLMLGSTILLGIGILGEYLGRIFASTELRPPYLVRELVTRSSKETTSQP
jgi:dolichol-phosphate mannosyltransferase/undecaprenyl-phosphate 4-deoxy-4-formamido-L-arabinose transferase